MLKRRWLAAAVIVMAPLWFGSPADAQIDSAKCRAAVVSSDERIAACTAVIEAGKGPSEGLAWAYRLRAREYLMTRDYDRAVADYSQVLQLYPRDRYAYMSRGDANFCKENVDQAIADYDQAIGLDPKDGHAYASRGAAYLHKDDFERAFADFSRALELNPSDVQAYLSRGSAHLAMGEFDRAIADFDRAIQISPTYKIAYFLRGSAYAVKGDFDQAVSDYDKAIRLDRKDARGYRFRAVVKLWAGSLAESLVDLDQSGELDPKSSYTALWREIVTRRSDLPSHLAEKTVQLDMTKWPAPVVRMFLDETALEAVLAAADDIDPKLRESRVCEANFYAGELALQRGSTEDAARLFGLTVADCPKNSVERSFAKAELKTLGVKP
jgi:tetratricopeptide (TPR) repeat protein